MKGPSDAEVLAACRVAFAAYERSYWWCNGLAIDGPPLTDWDDLGEFTRQAWLDAIRAVLWAERDNDLTQPPEN